MITRDEAEDDLKKTEQDIHALNMIIEGMELFGNTDQDRNFLRNDLFRYKGYLDEGNRVKNKIEEYLKKL